MTLFRASFDEVTCHRPGTEVTKATRRGHQTVPDSSIFQEFMFNNGNRAPRSGIRWIGKASKRMTDISRIRGVEIAARAPPDAIEAYVVQAVESTSTVWHILLSFRLRFESGGGRFASTRSVPNHPCCIGPI